MTRLRQHRAREAGAQIAAGPLWQDLGLIFANEVGTPMDPDNFSHSFAELCERTGLGHWHPHELRHSGTSQGTPLHVVSEVLGHSSIAITKDVYGHPLEPGSVRWLRSARGTQNNKKGPLRARGL